MAHQLGTSCSTDLNQLNVTFLKIGAAWPGVVSRIPWINNFYLLYKIFYRCLYVTMALGVLLYCFFAYETLEDLIENISVLGTVMAMLSRFYITVAFKNMLQEVIKSVDLKFYMPGEEEKQIAISAVKMARKISVSIFTLYAMTTVAMVAYPLTSPERVLPFKAWYPYINATESPYYEILYACQAAITVLIGWFAGSMDAFCFAMLFLCALQFRLVAQGFRKAKDISELKICIQYHQEVIKYVDDVCTFLNPIYIWQVLCDNILICVLGFQAMAMEQNGIKIVRVVLHLLCTIFQIGFICFFGQHLTTESSSIYEAAYENPWYEQSAAFRRMIWMVVERARKPAVLSGGFFGDISLPLFYSVMRSSYSYIAMLSQFNEERND